MMKRSRVYHTDSAGFAPFPQDAVRYTATVNRENHSLYFDYAVTLLQMPPGLQNLHRYLYHGR